tara:strand:+ start:116 stop:376 length:261 start_codon:yes stop_codon:yes gene_type:complete
MDRRIKKAKKSTESFFALIEQHIEKAIKFRENNDLIGQDYALKEIKVKFLPQAERKVEITGENKEKLATLKKKVKELEEINSNSFY